MELPTKRQLEVMQTVHSFYGGTLQEYGDRLKVTRGGALALLRSVKAKGFAEQDARRKWVLTLEGRKWLRPTWPQTRGAK